MKTFIITVFLISIFKLTAFAQWTAFYGPGYNSTSMASRSGYFFAGMQNDGIERYNFKTQRWTNTFGAGYVSSILVRGNLIFATTGALLLESTDTGSTWFPILNGNTDNVQKMCEFLCLAANDSFIFLGKNSVSYNYHVIFMSSNNGANWYASDAGIPIIMDQTYIYCIAANGNNIYAASSDGLYYSSNNGYSWMISGNFNHVWNIASSGRYVYACCYSPNALFRSSNNGTNWEQLSNGLPSNHGIDHITINGSNLFAGVDSNGIYMSLDYGDSWTAFNNGLNNLIVKYILLDGSNLYAGINNYIEKRDISSLLAVREPGSNTPKQFSLSQNYPNPFNPGTIINYQLPKSSFVELVVYNELGREIKTLVNKNQNAGSYKIEFDGTNLPSGVYFYRIEADKYVSVKKMVLIK